MTFSAVSIGQCGCCENLHPHRDSVGKADLYGLLLNVPCLSKCNILQHATPIFKGWDTCQVGSCHLAFEFSMLHSSRSPVLRKSHPPAECHILHPFSIPHPSRTWWEKVALPGSWSMSSIQVLAELVHLLQCLSLAELLSWAFSVPKMPCVRSSPCSDSDPAQKCTKRRKTTQWRQNRSWLFGSMTAMTAMTQPSPLCDLCVLQAQHGHQSYFQASTSPELGVGSILAKSGPSGPSLLPRGKIGHTVLHCSADLKLISESGLQKMLCFRSL